MLFGEEKMSITCRTVDIVTILIAPRSLILCRTVELQFQISIPVPKTKK